MDADLYKLLNCIDGERSNKTVTVAGGFLGALVVILLMLLSAVGIVIFVKKGIQNLVFSRSSPLAEECTLKIIMLFCIDSLWRQLRRRNLKLA